MCLQEGVRGVLSKAITSQMRWLVELAMQVGMKVGGSASKKHEKQNLCRP